MTGPWSPSATTPDARTRRGVSQYRGAPDATPVEVGEERTGHPCAKEAA